MAEDGTSPWLRAGQAAPGSWRAGAGQAPGAGCSRTAWQPAALLSRRCQRPSAAEQGPMDSGAERGTEVGRGGWGLRGWVQPLFGGWE